MSEHKAGKGRVPAGETALFCSQAALILKAGLPLHDGIASLRQDMEDSRGKRAFDTLVNTLEESGSLYEGVKASGIFPDYMVHMVRIGERAGKLEAVLSSLHRYYLWEEKTQKSIRGAITYPAVLLLMMTVVVSVLVLKVLPIFSQVLTNLGAELSTLSAALMNFGLTAGKCALGLMVVTAVVLAALYLVSKTRAGAGQLSRLFQWFPLTRRLSGKIAAGRFAGVMEMMLSSGYSLDDALELAPDILDGEGDRKKVRRCRELLSEGKSFAGAMEEMRLFAPLHQRMLQAGEQAGQLDAVLRELTELYEDEVEDSISQLVSFIEPAIVAVLSVIIGVILLSVMLPLSSIMSSIG